MYYAYGSNLSHAQMASRCPDSRYIGTATLDGYKFVYDGYVEIRKGAVANIVPAEGEQVLGAIYEISTDDLRLLDVYEQVAIGTYYRTKVPVSMRDNGEEVNAITYIRDPQPIGEPSEEYVAVINQGKKDCGIEKAVPGSVSSQ